MFYKKVNLNNDKEMFEFLDNHFTYYTMNSWNRLFSIANNVKIYNLNLEGDKWVALEMLRLENYSTINFLIKDWEDLHQGYNVGFNGRSGGYIILGNKKNNCNILPDHIADNDYEGYKEWCKDYQGNVKNNRYELQEYTKIVQDFDKLCDDIREYTNDLSKTDIALTILERAVDHFNIEYRNDLETLNIPKLMNENKTINVEKIMKINCLYESFIDILEEEIGRTSVKYEIGTNNIIEVFYD